MEPLDKFMIFQECIEFIWVAQNYRICFQIQTKFCRNERVEEISFFVFTLLDFLLNSFPANKMRESNNLTPFFLNYKD